MTESEKLFHKIAEDVPGAVEGKMFGALCIKSNNGKVATIFWKNDMLFKLNAKELDEALKLPDARKGFHLYAPDKPMKGWVLIAKNHSTEWAKYAHKAIEYIKTLV